MTSSTIKQRLLALLRASPYPEKLLQRAEQLAADQNDDGSWPDLADQDPFAGSPANGPEHLRRTLLLAQTRELADGALDDGLRRALDFWLAHDFLAPGWPQNQLTVPRLVGSTALLFDEGLSAGARGKVMEILARSRWQHWSAPSGWTDWTGTTLLHVAHNVVLRGCLDEARAGFEEAFARVFRAIRPAPEGEAGIQPDMVYRVPPAVTPNGPEGLAYAAACVRFAALAHGTTWQAPTPALELLASFLLDGQQWLMRNGVIDAAFSADGGAAEPPVDLGGLAAAIKDLAQHVDTPRRAELADLGRRLLGTGEMLAGHRHFWRSGFSVHQRPAFYASVYLSPPLAPAGAGTPAVVPPAGTTRVMRSGHEYDDLALGAGVNGPPGTTFFRGARPSADPEPKEAPTLAGAISEGDYGLAAMKVEAPGLNVTKSWYYFDQAFVCLGAGLTAGGTGQPVCTSVNECRLNTPVLAAADLAQARPLSPGHEHAMPRARRASHDGITYYFLQPSRVIVQAGHLRGDDDPGADPGNPERFALLLNHGTSPQDESYAYIVLPNGEDGAVKVRTDEEVGQIEVLANTPFVQAVRHKGLKLVGVTFWKAGTVTVPGGGRVAANQPCVLLCHDATPSGRRLSIGNLRREATTVHVEYAGRSVGFELPGGPDAGRGVSRSM